MVALECALSWNPEPLQKFAALKDFTGESISFLTNLTTWKMRWHEQIRSTQRSSFTIQQQQQQQQRHHQEPLRGDSLREAYNSALAIYAIFISPDHAEFPLNLCSRTLRTLDALFANAANLLLGDSSSQNTVNSATPFNIEQDKSVTVSDIQEVQRDTDVTCLDGVYYWGVMPQDFSPDCFDDAEREIKYLVLTNTWPKFVNAGFAEHVRDSQGRTLGRRLAQHFFRRDGR